MTTITVAESQAVLDDAKLLLSARQIEAAITKVAEQITQVLATEQPLVLPVMVGSLIFASELIQKLQFPLQLDYIHATRYRNTTEGADLQWLKKPTALLKDKTVLLVDDILDYGITLAATVSYCYDAGAKKVWTAVLLDKKIATAKPLTADFICFEVPDYYVFGYGMDYHGYHRNLKNIYAVNE